MHFILVVQIFTSSIFVLVFCWLENVDQSAHNGQISCVSFDMSSSILITAATDSMVKLWDARNGTATSYYCYPAAKSDDQFKLTTLSMIFDVLNVAEFMSHHVGTTFD